MSESIKDINSGDLIGDDKTMVSIKDSSVNNFISRILLMI